RRHAHRHPGRRRQDRPRAGGADDRRRRPPHLLRRRAGLHRHQEGEVPRRRRGPPAVPADPGGHVRPGHLGAHRPPAPRGHPPPPPLAAPRAGDRDVHLQRTHHLHRRRRRPEHQRRTGNHRQTVGGHPRRRGHRVPLPPAVAGARPTPKIAKARRPRIVRGGGLKSARAVRLLGDRLLAVGFATVGGGLLGGGLLGGGAVLAGSVTAVLERVRRVLLVGDGDVRRVLVRRGAG